MAFMSKKFNELRKAACVSFVTMNFQLIQDDFQRLYLAVEGGEFTQPIKEHFILQCIANIQHTWRCMVFTGQEGEGQM